MKVKIQNTIKMSSPHLFALLVTQDSGGNTNVMGVSWYCFASLRPPKMVVCLGNKGYSGQLIKETDRFALCLPTEAIKDKAMACCKCSGRDTDKIREFALDLIMPEGFKVPAVKGSKLVWELSLTDTMPAGDHTVYLADIMRAAKLSDDKNLYAFDGYKELKTI